MLTLAKELTLDTAAVKRRRNSLGLTMEQAAKAAGFTGGRQQWNNIENSPKTDVTLSTLGKLAKALQCEPSDLLK